MTNSVRHFGTSHSSWILLLGFRISVPCCFKKCLIWVWPRKGICLYCIILHCNYNKHKWPKFGRYPRPPTSFTESQNVTKTPDPNPKTSSASTKTASITTKTPSTPRLFCHKTSVVAILCNFWPFLWHNILSISFLFQSCVTYTVSSVRL